MKEKLEKFSLEMIQEIKDLKDLAKGELPEVAKEYIKFVEVSSLIYMIFFGVLTLTLTTVCIFSGVYGEKFSLLPLLTGIGAFISGIPTVLSFGEYLEAKMTPRRTAIKAITSLL